MEDTITTELNSSFEPPPEALMRRALELAERGLGWTNPNPLVGAVIVKQGRIVGEGFHQRFGGPHAEVHALEAAGERARGAELYVNLEPCAHQGKTPPCVERIIAAGIKKVYIATRDPNPLVSGRGVERLRQAGIEVVEGVLAEEAQKLNEHFFKFIRTGRPFVVLKLATTLDGRIADSEGNSRWISSERSRQLVHLLRQRYMAVLVGVGTVLRDDPQLTVRELPAGLEPRQPLRVVLDSTGRTPPEARVLDKSAPTAIATTPRMPEEAEARYRARGAQVWRFGEDDRGRVDLHKLIEHLGREGYDSLLVEGGAEVAAGFLRAGLVDKLILFIAPKLLGKGLPAVGELGIDRLERALRLEKVTVRLEGEDLVYEAYPASVGANAKEKGEEEER